MQCVVFDKTGSYSACGGVSYILDLNPVMCLMVHGFNFSEHDPKQRLDGGT